MLDNIELGVQLHTGGTVAAKGEVFLTARDLIRRGKAGLAALALLPYALACSSAGSLVPLKTAAPPFPDIMAQAHLEGEVVVRVAVGRDGVVYDAEVVRIKGQKRWFPRPAEYEAAARQWLFHTNEEGGSLDIHFLYRLLDPCAPESAEGATLVRPNKMVLQRRKPLIVPTHSRIDPCLQPPKS